MYLMPEIVAVTKVFSRGQTHIPVEIRKRLKIRDGDKIVWIEDNGRFYITLKKARLPDLS